jgi:hypothetical protein
MTHTNRNQKKTFNNFLEDKRLSNFFKQE